MPGIYLIYKLLNHVVSARGRPFDFEYQPLYPPCNTAPAISVDLPTGSRSVSSSTEPGQQSPERGLQPPPKRHRPFWGYIRTIKVRRSQVPAPETLHRTI